MSSLFKMNNLNACLCLRSIWWRRPPLLQEWFVDRFSKPEWRFKQRVARSSYRDPREIQNWLRERERETVSWIDWDPTEMVEWWSHLWDGDEVMKISNQTLAPKPTMRRRSKDGESVSRFIKLEVNDQQALNSKQIWARWIWGWRYADKRRGGWNGPMRAAEGDETADGLTVPNQAGGCGERKSDVRLMEGLKMWKVVYCRWVGTKEVNYHSWL